MVSFDNPFRAILPPVFPSAGTDNCGMLEWSNCSKLKIWVFTGRLQPVVMWDLQCTVTLRAGRHASRALIFDSFRSAVMTSRLKRKLNDLGVDTSSSKANESFCLVSHSTPDFERPTVNQLPR